MKRSPFPRWGRVFQRAPAVEVDDELQFHIEECIRESIARGASPDEARKEALARFGEIDAVRRVCTELLNQERTEEARKNRLAASWLDFKLGFRMLRRYPGLSLIGGVALSAAIGIGVLAFELITSNLNPSLPLEEGDRIVRIENWNRATGSVEPHALHDFQLWRDELNSVVELGVARSMERNLILPEGPPRPIPVAEVTPNAFTLTRAPPLLGRFLVEADAVPGGPAAVVIGYDLWQGALAGDRDIVGKMVQLGDTRATVVGVMPEGYGFPRFQQAWLPLRETANAPGEGPPVLVFGRLAPGVTIERARTEIETVSARLAAEEPAYREHLQTRVVPFAAALAPVATPVFLLAIFTLVFAVMGGISANVATLMFARTALREPEIVVRNALGATRGRVILQLVVESLVLAGVATVGGILIAAGILRVIWYQSAVVNHQPQPFWSDANLEPATVLWALGLGVVGAVLVGLLPGIKATKGQVRGALAQAHSGASALRFGGVWSFLIVGQVVFTVMCLAMAIGVSSESLRDRNLRAPFPLEAYLTFKVQFDSEERGEGQSEAERARLAADYQELERRLLAEPSISAVAMGSDLPGTDQTLRFMEAQRGREKPFVILGTFDDYVASSRVDPGFFDVFGLRILAGRGLSGSDVGAATVVVNEALASKLGGNPVGMLIRDAAPRADGGVAVGEPGPWQEVVGVVANAGLDPTDRGEGDFLYHAALPSELSSGYFAARMRDRGGNLAARIPAIALSIDPALRVSDVLPLDEVVRRGGRNAAMMALGVILVVSLALTLSAAGLFALMAVSVDRRRREIGVRMALGSSTGGVLGVVLKRAAVQLGIGLLIGNALLLGLRALTARGGVTVSSIVLPMLGISALMVLVGVAACAGPARRALRVQPTEAIKGVG